MLNLVFFALICNAADNSLSPDYAVLRGKAIAENRPLIVWVGVVRPDIEVTRPDALHLRCDQFPGAVSPCVVVGRPDKGELWRIVDLPAAQADRLKPVLRRTCGPTGCTYSSVLEY
jgi:hypothetical protein